MTQNRRVSPAVKSKIEKVSKPINRVEAENLLRKKAGKKTEVRQTAVRDKSKIRTRKAAERTQKTRHIYVIEGTRIVLETEIIGNTKVISVSDKKLADSAIQRHLLRQNKIQAKTSKEIVKPAINPVKRPEKEVKIKRTGRVMRANPRPQIVVVSRPGNVNRKSGGKNA